MLYVVLAGVLNQLSGKPLDTMLFITLTWVFVSGVSISHVLRISIVKLKLTKLSIIKLIPTIAGISLLFGAIFQLAYLLFFMIISGQKSISISGTESIIQYFGWVTIFIIWSLFYFAFLYFENYRKEEIKNLQLETSRIEIELNSLKSQLNPHFLFNAMNSIRALIEENPAMAKKAITQLATILRNSFQTGKKKEIMFSEELELVTDYLELEKIRYEERLQFVLKIHDDSYQQKIPPLMLQTLIENAVKHGIAKKNSGGIIELNTKFEDNNHIINIKNTGQLKQENNNSGLGLKNTKERLFLLYGNNASIKILAENEFVITEILIPLHTKTI
jgi:two-component system, LytTR family, sensor kinase